jgi:uncharacterized protein (TIGR00299 family) protein
MKILYYDCFAGISGDMHLGALIDLGVDPDHLLTHLKKLNLDGYEINITRDERKGISGTRVDVILRDTAKRSKESKHPEGANLSQTGHKHHRNLEDISGIIDRSKLPGQVKERSLKMFWKLAEAEAKIHGKTINEVHFHEVGAIDSIVDIVGAAICIEYLKPDQILASEVQLGGGFVKCAHGTFPVPAPATAEILKDVPVRTGAVEFECTTPTGALILACNVDEFVPMQGMKILKTAYGIGQKDPDIPNVLRVFELESDLIEATGSETREASSIESGNGSLTEPAWMLESNIDDMVPEVYGHIMELLFEQGADDVFITPIIMKKARPASKLSVLCSPSRKEDLIEAMLLHTTSLGVRSYPLKKTMLEREFSTLETRYGKVRIKTALLGGQKLRSKPEYEDCVRLAKEHKVPVQKIYNEINGLIGDNFD